MADNYSGQLAALTSPVEHIALVTPSDSVDLARPSRGLALTTAGTLKVTTVGGEAVTLASGCLSAGIIHPIRVTRIWSTGTSAAGIAVFW